MAENSPKARSTEPVADPLGVLRAQMEGRLDVCARLMGRGVQIIDPMTTYIGKGVEIGAETVIYPNTTVSGASAIGRRCQIGPNTVIVDSRLGDEVTVLASVLEGVTIEGGTDIGPFSHLRPRTHVGREVHIGNFVEVKASRLGSGSKIGHFCYIGDAQVGSGVNIGAGTVTCNYDGRKKNRTVIEDGAFIGSDTMLVAPVRVGRGAVTGAGAVVTSDVPDGTRVAGVPARAIKRPNPQRRRKGDGQR